MVNLNFMSILGLETRLLWSGTDLELVHMYPYVARDYDLVFGEGRLPNRIEYNRFLEYREVIKTIIALEDIVKQYAVTSVQLPMIEDQIRELRAKYNINESKIEETYHTAS